MRITNLKTKNGKKLDSNEMNVLLCRVAFQIRKAGFITEVSQNNSSSVRIGLHMKSFTIDTSILGHNARVNEWTLKRCKAGYARTNIPTWTQREEFNHIVNNVLDSLKLTAHIRSGEYTIRTVRDGRVNQWEMPETFHNGYRLQVQSVLEIVPLKYASDGVQWVGVNAPFVGAVPPIRPRFAPRNLKLVA